jgi:hypothetical protein
LRATAGEGDLGPGEELASRTEARAQTHAAVREGLPEARDAGLPDGPVDKPVGAGGEPGQTAETLAGYVTGAAWENSQTLRDAAPAAAVLGLKGLSIAFGGRPIGDLAGPAADLLAGATGKEKGERLAGAIEKATGSLPGAVLQGDPMNAPVAAVIEEGLLRAELHRAQPSKHRPDEPGPDQRL